MAASPHSDDPLGGDGDLRDPWSSDDLSSFDPFASAEGWGDTSASSHVPPEPAAGASAAPGPRAGRFDLLRSRAGRFDPLRSLAGRPTLPGSTERRFDLRRARTAGAPGTAPATATRAQRTRKSTYLPAVVVLIGGSVAAASVYLAFDEIRPLSTDPLGSALTLFAICALGLALCTIGLVIAIRGAVVARPRHRPIIAILLAVLLVPVLVGGAGSMGLNKAKRSMQDSAADDMGRTVVSVLKFIEDEGIDLGPLSALID